MLKLILGRNQDLLAQTLLRSASQVSGNCIVIVPEQYSHATERLLCQLGGDTVSLHTEVLTFSRLAQRVFQERGGSARAQLDQGGRLLLMHLAVQRLAGELIVYSRAGKKISFLSNLLHTSDECKSYCIFPEDLLRVSADIAGENGQRIRELGLIFGAYNALCAQRAEDPRDRLTRLAETLSGSDYLNGKRIFIYGFTDFTPQEKRVLAIMLRKASEVCVGLRCDTIETDGDSVFEPSRTTALSLIAAARDQHVGAEYDTLLCTDLPAELAHLERELFAAAPEPYAGECTRISLTETNNPYSEICRVAEEIVHLVRDEGFRFRDIAVAARTIDGWSDRIELVFADYHIPFFVSRKDDILAKPILSLLTAALSAVSGGYEYEDMFRYLKTGLTGIDRDECDLLENYVLRWDIRSSRWTSDMDWNWHPDGYGQEWKAAHYALVEHLDALRRRVIAPLETLRNTNACTGRELAQAVYHFLEEIDLPHTLSNRTAELAESGALLEAEEYRQVWEILIGALEQCADLLEDDELTLADFTELFRLVLSQYQIGAIPVSLDRVTCGDMSRISHSSHKVLFLLGADDASIPMVHPDNGLLTQEDKVLLTQRGLETPLSSDQQLDREMLLIYECCTMPQERLSISWSARDMDGTEKRRSFLISRLQQIFPRGLPSLRAQTLPSGMHSALEYAAEHGDRSLLRQMQRLPDGNLAERTLTAMDGRRENLTPEAVEELYRGKVQLSASRMDKVKSCHYAYFLQYGLQAKARKPAGMDAPETGTFVHFVLETVLKAGRAQGGIAALTADRISELVELAAQEFIRDQLGGMENQTQRFRYLFQRLVRSAHQVVLYMIEELQASDFEPIAFELGFGRNEELPPVQLTVNGIQVSISGFVDRVDGWVHDDRLYLRVVDYKTGKKSFDFTDIWHGLNLQMLLYLFTLQEKGMPGSVLPVTPAGVLYLPAREEMISGSRTMEEMKRLREIGKKLKRSGLVLNDPNVIDAMEHVPLGAETRFIPVKISKKGEISGGSLASAEQMGKLHRHIQRVLRSIAAEIGSGIIAADPWYKDDNHSACNYCDFAAACHFEDGQCGEQRRYLYKMAGDDFWEQLEASDEKGGVNEWASN